MTTPAMVVYQKVTPLRDVHAEVIWDGRVATAQELREILADLEKRLTELATPLNQDLAEGNTFLRYRRFNFLIDKVLILDRLGDTAGAIRAWQELHRISWHDLTTGPQRAARSQFARMLRLPETASIRSQLAVSRRWGGEGAIESPYRDSLPVEERIAGLSKLWSAARDGFVWFDLVPDLDWDRAYLEAIPRVIAAESTELYYRELMRFVALLRNSHCNVYVPRELSAQFYSKPGIRCARIEGAVIVIEVTDVELSELGLAVGDEVLHIDGIEVEQYAQKHVQPYECGQTEQDLEIRVYTFALLAGPAERSVRLETRTSEGTVKSFAAKRSDYLNRGGRPTESFHVRADGVAVIEAAQFENEAAVKLLDQHLAEVMQANGLVVDLRRNGGGSGSVGLALLSFLSDVPLPSMVASYRENTPFDSARVGNNTAIRWRTIPSDSVSIARALRYSGPVAMLIGANTHSAAEDTAAIFRLMYRGIIVGTASAGGTGQPWIFGLPGGGRGRICVKRNEYPDGSTFVGVGIRPDIEVPLTLADVRAGRDAALERAAQALLASIEGDA